MKQFTVICSKQDYEEVAEILQGWGYRQGYYSWYVNENCITTAADCFFSFALCDLPDPNEPRYTLEELRTMENPNTETL